MKNEGFRVANVSIIHFFYELKSNFKETIHLSFGSQLNDTTIYGSVFDCIIYSALRVLPGVFRIGNNSRSRRFCWKIDRLYSLI